MSFFTVSGLGAGYGDRAVLREVSFALEAGQLVGVLGANGSGKTTLLKAVCGILPHTGRCTLEGIGLEGLSARQLARRCSYIPQRSGIGIDLPVLDVVLMGFNPWSSPPPPCASGPPPPWPRWGWPAGSRRITCI